MFFNKHSKIPDVKYAYRNMDAQNMLAICLYDAVNDYQIQSLVFFWVDKIRKCLWILQMSRRGCFKRRKRTEVFHKTFETHSITVPRVLFCLGIEKSYSAKPFVSILLPRLLYWRLLIETSQGHWVPKMLKAHSRFWDNFWQLKSHCFLCFFFHFEKSFRSQDI